MIDYKAQDKALAVIAKNTEREIERAYATSLRNIRKELAFYADRFDVDGLLTYNEMSKYNRLLNLDSDVRNELIKLNRAWEGVLDKGTSAQYFESYFLQGYGIEREALAKLSYTALPKEAIQRAIENPFKQLALDRNRNDVILKLRQTITQGLVEGSSYSALSRRVKDSLGENMNNAMRITRTETHRVVQQGRLDSTEHAEALGVEMVKVWQSTLDDRTRDTHGAMDGQERAIDEEFASPSGARALAPSQFGIAEEDINCRCTMETRLKGFAPEFRRVRGEGVVPQKNYKQWAEEKGISNPYLD